MERKEHGAVNLPHQVQFGFDLDLELDTSPSDVAVKKKASVLHSHPGLGTGLGGELVRSALGNTGAAISAKPMTTTPRFSRSNDATGRQRSQTKDQLERDELPSREQLANAVTSSMLDGQEPRGMFLGLLLNDSGQVTAEDLKLVTTHRWYFKGAEELAMQSQSFYCFVRCLLELQRNVQIQEDGEALDPTLKRACKSFVAAQCREGSMGNMYQLLTHFLSNSLVFIEWDRFLRSTFENQRATQEMFLVPHLEQVWNRFRRFRTVLEEIFDILNSRYVWHHRLPKVGELMREHIAASMFFLGAYHTE